MQRAKTTKERGKYKMIIHNALFKSNNIKELILGDLEKQDSSKIITEFKDHVKSHLFIDETIMETGTYIFYDVIITTLSTNIKTCKITMYLVTHRDILENYSKENYYGDRVDILSQMVEEVLLDDKIVKEFGIGELTLDSVNIYNATKLYGCIMNFSVPNFR